MNRRCVTKQMNVNDDEKVLSDERRDSYCKNSRAKQAKIIRF